MAIEVEMRVMDKAANGLLYFRKDEIVFDAGCTKTSIIIKTINGVAASSTDDIYNGKTIKWYGEQRLVKDYVGATKTLIVSGFSAVPPVDNVGYMYDLFKLEDALFDDELAIDKRLEFTDVFEFAYSSLDLTFNNDAREAYEYFKQENGFGNEITWLSCLVKKNGTPKFWGYVDPESFDWDETQEEISLTVIDWYKWINNYCADQILEFIDAETTATLEYILMLNLSCDIIEGFEAYVGTISQTLINSDYRNLASVGCTKGRLLTEIQKNYGAFFYINENKKLVLGNRNSSINEEAIDVRSDIMRESVGGTKDNLKSEFVKNDNDSVLMNFKGHFYYYQDPERLYDPVITEVNGLWVLMSYNKDKNLLEATSAHSDLGNLPEDAKYIDIRQELITTSEEEIASGFLQHIYGENDYKIGIEGNQDFLVGNSIWFYDQAGENLQAYGTIKERTPIDELTSRIILNGYYNLGVGIPDPEGPGPLGGVVGPIPIKVMKYTFGIAYGQYALFEARDQADRWQDFKSILFPQRKVTKSINRTDIGLFNKIKIDDTNNEYIILKAKEYIRDTDDYVDVEAYMLPNIDPDL